MGALKNLFNTRNALQSIDFGNLLYAISEDEREVLQVTILNVYKDVLNLSKEYHFTPFWVGGSALGAIRHKGFIP